MNILGFFFKIRSQIAGACYWIFIGKQAGSYPRRGGRLTALLLPSDLCWSIARL